MSDSLEFIPGYISPLTDTDHARIGRIAILWGQVEHSVEAILPHITGLSWVELTAIKVADKPIGSKVELLNLARDRLDDEALSEQVREFCASINETKVQRNHLFHGMWGWRGHPRTKTMTPAARKTSNPDQPLNATQLPSLEKRLCRSSRLGSDIVMQLHDEDYRVKYMRFLHHGETDSAPEWMMQWSKRNPVDDVALDRNAPKGQLPRLAVPYPMK